MYWIFGLFKRLGINGFLQLHSIKSMSPADIGHIKRTYKKTTKLKTRGGKQASKKNKK